MQNLIIMILWCAFSFLIVEEYAPYCKDLDKTDKIIAMVIFVIGGPFFVITNILETILDTLLPEGWDDDHDFKGY